MLGRIPNAFGLVVQKRKGSGRGWEKRGISSSASPWKAWRYVHLSRPFL